MYNINKLPNKKNKKFYKSVKLVKSLEKTNRDLSKMHVFRLDEASEPTTNRSPRGFCHLSLRFTDGEELSLFLFTAQKLLKSHDYLIEIIDLITLYNLLINKGI